MSSKNLQDHEHFVRHCSVQKQVRGANGEILGVAPTAFELRPNENYLSGALLESSSGDLMAQLLYVRTAMGRKLKMAPSSLFAVCSASKFRECGISRSIKLRLIHEPNKSDDTYATIRRLPLNNTESILLAMLAANVKSLHMLSEMEN